VYAGLENGLEWWNGLWNGLWNYTHTKKTFFFAAILESTV